MRQEIYNLPDISFVGGESQTFAFNLYTKSKQAFDADDCTVNFAMINYTNKSGDPVISKLAEVEVGLEGVKNRVVVDLVPSDTLNLYGKYIYQIILRDVGGAIEIPGQGVVTVMKNINTSFVSM